MGLLQRPRSARTDAEIQGLERFAAPGAAEERGRHAYGDWLDAWSVREVMRDGKKSVLLVAMLFFLLGDFAFGWNSGDIVFPWLRIKTWVWGGILPVANSVAFIAFVDLYVEAKKVPRQNPWTVHVLVSFLLAFICIYVSQTSAADAVRKIVERRTAVELEISKLEQEIPNTFVRSRAPVEASLEEALNQAVGSHLSVLSSDEADKQCAAVKPLVDHMTCRQKALRDAVDCAVDMEPLVRETTCTPIAAYRATLRTIDQDAAELEARKTRLGLKDGEKGPTGLYLQLRDMPEASNGFIRMLSKWTGWSVDDAQSRFYIGLALFFLLSPALTLPEILKIRSAAPPPPSPAGA